MRIWLSRRHLSLIPTDEDSSRVIHRLGEGECVQVSVSRIRSIKWHRLYFGLCKLIGENSDPHRRADAVDPEIRVRAGHYDCYEVDGHEVRVPKRIAFTELTADEWAELWPSIELAMSERYGVTAADYTFAGSAGATLFPNEGAGVHRLPRARAPAISRNSPSERLSTRGQRAAGRHLHDTAVRMASPRGSD